MAVATRSGMENVAPASPVRPAAPAAEGPLRVGVSGSYGGWNVGDEAILTALVARLRRDWPDARVTVFGRNPDHTLACHDVQRAVTVRELTREEARGEVAELDLLILGGGGLLYDRDLEVYLREVALANELGVPVAVYAVGAGPLDRKVSRELLREHLGPAAVVSVRDRQSKRLLEDAKVEGEIHVTADPAFLLEPEELPEGTLERERLDTDRRVVAFSVREPGPAAPDLEAEHYHALLANAADFMIDRYDAEIVFVPMERRKVDVQHSHGVLARMELARRAGVLKGDYTPQQLLALFRHFDFALGMRLHFLVFAALQGVPFIALPYAPKVQSLTEELEMVMPPLERVTTGRLLAHIDHSWDRREEVREQIGERLPGLRERASRTQGLVTAKLPSSPVLGRPA